MAIIHYDVVFEKGSPTLLAVKEKIDQRMGLRTHLVKDSIEKGHRWPHIGEVRESGTFECDKCEGSELAITVVSHGVRSTGVPALAHPASRGMALAALSDVGGIFEA